MENQDKLYLRVDVGGGSISAYAKYGDQKESITVTQPKRKFIGLTDQEISNIWFEHGPRETINGYDFARAIEAKFKEKNT